MKLIYAINSYTSIEVDCANVKDIIKELTQLRDSVEFEFCGQCKGQTVLRHRKNADEDDFYEHVCVEPTCRAVLELGSNKEGNTLYKKRMKTGKKGTAIKSEDGKAEYLPKNGWGKYNPETKQKEY